MMCMYSQMLKDLVLFCGHRFDEYDFVIFSVQHNICIQSLSAPIVTSFHSGYNQLVLSVAF